MTDLCPGIASKVAVTAGGLGASALLFTGLLRSGVGAPLGIQLRYDSIVFPVVLGVLFLAIARLPRALTAPALTLLSAGWCATVLSGVWTAAVSDLSLQAGIFQQRDSFTKLEASVDLLLGGMLPDAASRRPLSPAVDAVLLFVCQGNVRWMLALTVFLVALALALPVLELVRTHGWPAGYTLYLALFFFYRRFIGTCLSEHLGLALGCLAFALLWRAARSARALPIPVGVFILTLSLNARAGAFFALPALALWSGRALRGNSRFSAAACIAACLAAGAGFALNAAVLHTLGNPAAAMGNFSYTLYGLVHGGDWKMVIKDHPEVRLLPEIERNKAIFDLAFRRIAERPASLPAGMLRAWRSFFLSADGPLSFTRFALQRSNLRIRPPGDDQGGSLLHRLAADPMKYGQIAATLGWFLVLSLLAVAGVAVMVRDGGPASALSLYAGAGVLASVPFAPPWDADLMRVYAATIPFMMVFPAVGAAATVARAGRRWLAESWPPTRTADNGTGLLVLALVVVPALCLAPLLLKQRPSPVPVAGRAAAAGERWMLRLLPGSQIRLSAGGRRAAWSGIVDVAEARRNTGVLALNYPSRAAELDAVLAAGGTLAMGYEHRTRALRYLLMADSQDGLPGGGWAEVEAEPVSGDEEPLWWRIRAAAPASP